MLNTDLARYKPPGVETTGISDIGFHSFTATGSLVNSMYRGLQDAKNFGFSVRCVKDD